MLKKNPLRYLLPLLLLVTSLFAFSVTAAAAPKLNTKKVTLNAGQTLQLRLTGTTQTVKWSSSRSSVARVSQTGLVSARKKGSATIYAKVGRKKYSCRVTVKQPVRSVSITKKSVTLKGRGKKTTLKARISPSNASNRSVTWTSSNKKVATVTSKGVVKSIGAGSCYITVTTKDGRKKATCRVTVTIPPVRVTKIKLSRTSLSLTGAGKTYTLKASISPSKATNKALTWTSSNSRVATVTAGGVVRVTGTGSCTITATAKDGSRKRASCKIRAVVPVVKVSSVKLSKSAVTLSGIGKTYSLKASVSPSNATNKALTWTSSNGKVATVTTGGIVKAVGKGSCTITATAKDGSRKKATCKVTVTIPAVTPPTKPTEPTKPSTPETEKPSDPKPQGVAKVASGIGTTSVNIPDVQPPCYDENGSYYMVGDTVKLSATASPSNASDKRVTWTSSDTSVATVDANGNVTIKGSGTCFITAAAVNWGVPADKVSMVNTYNWSLARQAAEFQPRGEYNIVARSAHTQLYDINFTTDDVNGDGRLAITKKMISIGATKKLSPVLLSTSSSPKHTELIYTSSNPAIATVSNDGVITGKAMGYVTISAKTKYPTQNGAYPSASITYRIGAYTYKDVVANLELDREAGQAAHEQLNLIRTTPEERPIGKDRPAAPARKWEEEFLQESVARASYNVVHTIIGNWQGTISQVNPLATHGGSQNGYGSSWLETGSYLGTSAATGLVTDAAHMVNQLSTIDKYDAVAFVRYRNPSGVNITSMIVTMSNVSMEEGRKNCAAAGISVLDDMVAGTQVVKQEYIDYCNHFGIVAG